MLGLDSSDYCGCVSCVGVGYTNWQEVLRQPVG